MCSRFFTIATSKYVHNAMHICVYAYYCIYGLSILSAEPALRAPVPEDAELHRPSASPDRWIAAKLGA